MATVNASRLTRGQAELWWSNEQARTPTGANPATTGTPIIMGNVSVGNLTPNITYVEHYVSTKGERIKDKEVAITKGVTINLTFDEINATNIDRFVLGSMTAAADGTVGQSIVFIRESIEGRAIIDFNTSVGTKFRYIIPHAVLKPDGNMPLVNEDWMTQSFNLEVLQHTTYQMLASLSLSLTPFGYIDYDATLADLQYYW